MKSALFLLFTFLTSSIVFAQDSWKISHGGKVLLNTSKENETKNVLNLKASGLTKTGVLQVSYSDKSKEKDWDRTIAVFDKEDNELIRHTGSVLKIPNSQLRTLTKNAKTIRIYSWSLPRDPELAARIRVRRVHLATVVIK